MAWSGLFRSSRDADVLAQADSARAARDWRRAAGLYRKILARHPDSAAIWVQYGHALKESGELVAAERAYRDALRLEAANADTHLQLGHALKLLGQHDDARAAYLAALALNPTLEGAQRELAEPGGRTPNPPAMPGEARPLDVEWQIDPALAPELLAHVARIWARLGEERPHWSVYAADQFLPQNMPAQRDAFYCSGAVDAKMLIATLARVGRAPEEFATVCEFGCGLARVTAHLSRHFRRIVAWDISPVHLAAARDLLRERGVGNVELRQTTAVDFAMPDGFDLWFSSLVLQHNPPPLIALILERAFQMLRPGGVAIFQLPTYTPGYRFALDDYQRGIGAAGNNFEMHLLPQPAVFEIARAANCAPLEVREDLATGPWWSSQVFTFHKP